MGKARAAPKVPRSVFAFPYLGLPKPSARPVSLAPPMLKFRYGVALLVAVVALVACSPGQAAIRTHTNANGDKIIYYPEPSSGPYVVVAVDDHFHDIHPIDRNRIAESRPFIVKNEGRNLHNFTVVGTDI